MCAYLCVLQRLTTLLSYVRWFEHILDTDLLRIQSFRIIHHYHKFFRHKEIRDPTERTATSTEFREHRLGTGGLQPHWLAKFLQWHIPLGRCSPIAEHQKNKRVLDGIESSTVRIGILSMKPTWSGRRLDKVVSPLPDQVHMESITFKCFAGLGFVAVRNLCFGSLLPCTTDRALSVKPTSSRIQR